jgi:hypothetical protein
MKLLIMFLFSFILVFSIKAQEIPRTFKPKEFKIDTSYKEIPTLKFHESFREKLLERDTKGAENYLRAPSLGLDNPTTETKEFSEYNMPIYKPLFLSEMPVHQPGSSINFHLLVKKVGAKEPADRLLE